MTLQPVYFSVTDGSIAKFARKARKPNDCVINALLLVERIDPYHAELLRIAVGDTGLCGHQIEELFDFLDPKWKYTLKSHSLNQVDIAHRRIKSVPESTLLFMGLRWKTTNQLHVFVMGRTRDGTLIIIDPQLAQPFQNVEEYLKQASELFILMKRPKS
jgi:hypothetical protein